MRLSNNSPTSLVITELPRMDANATWKSRSSDHFLVMVSPHRHQVEYGVEHVQVMGLDQNGRFGDDCPFNMRTGTQQFERPLMLATMRGIGIRLADINADPTRIPNSSLNLKRDQGFTDRRSGHVELFRQFTLGGQACANRQRAGIQIGPIWSATCR